MRSPAIYIITNYTRSVLYVGVTSDLIKRIYQHKERMIEGFSKCYQCKYLMYYEQAETMEAAINREKQVKAYRREKKNALIEAQNPEWKDLYVELL